MGEEEQRRERYGRKERNRKRRIDTGVDHGGMRGCIPPTTEAGGWAVQSPPPYKGDEQMKSILHNTQIITPEEIVSRADEINTPQYSNHYSRRDCIIHR